MCSDISTRDVHNFPDLALRAHAKLLAWKILTGTFHVSMRVPIETPCECIRK